MTGRRAVDPDRIPGLFVDGRLSGLPMTAARQLAETKERIMSDEKSGLTVDTRPETHWPDCWRDQAHHNCAVALIDWQWGVIGKLLRAKATERDAEAAAGEQHYCGSCGA